MCFCFSLSVVLCLGLRLAKCIYTDAVQKKILLLFFIINVGHAHSCISLCILFCNYAILNCILNICVTISVFYISFAVNNCLGLWPARCLCASAIVRNSQKAR